MRGLWQCLGYAGSLVSVMLAQPASANGEIDDDEYEVLWVTKRMDNKPRHAKRKDTCQVSGWSLCPASVGGGCCPDNFECDTASCYATTAGPTSCNGATGYYNCPLTRGAGSCCPVGLICDDGGGCVSPQGGSMSCPANWFGCAASLGGGCCRDGQVCGSDKCYDNTTKTLPVSETKTTTDSRGHTTITVVTSMATIVDAPNTSDSAAAAGVPQLVPSTVGKLPAIQTGDSEGESGGLSSGALGGIVAGVVVLLIAIVVSATIIILKLRRNEKADKSNEKSNESKRELPDSPPRSHKSGFGQPSISEVDATTDAGSHAFPIMHMSPQSRARSATNGTVSTGTPNFASSDTSSPPLWSAQFNYGSSVPPDGRKVSMDSYPHHDNGNMRTSQVVSVDSQAQYIHSRQSSVSELEASAARQELSAAENTDAEPQRRSNSITRPGISHARRNSDFSGQNRARGDSNTGPGLGTVNETIFELHGYYGPDHKAAGQTLDRGSSTASSPSVRHEDP
ncbi:hypothetical protein O1611_g4617 [Lasiodiplodia mahajangana]|uniref:Uncharacterized protein n=1 Tax=Lasiodiplodia mahajangana TaxID=1108764 RepID=A0ACC2JNI4_9PEZI|nr:hypothetical protein O1611_g4617 [Lasiodiplodia mahajangana]